MREQNTQGENKMKEYQQMAELWAQEIGISDANRLADIKARIQELFGIGTKPEKIQQYFREFQAKFQTLLEHHEEVMAYTQVCRATLKTIDNIKQRSQMPTLTFDIHVGYVKNYFREQLAMIYQPGTDLYRDLSEWGDTQIENMAQHGISITIIGGKVRDIPRRFQSFLAVIGASIPAERQIEKERQQTLIKTHGRGCGVMKP
jgi:hypothetical protein